MSGMGISWMRHPSQDSSDHLFCGSRRSLFNSPFWVYIFPFSVVGRAQLRKELLQSPVVSLWDASWRRHQKKHHHHREKELIIWQLQKIQLTTNNLVNKKTQKQKGGQFRQMSTFNKKNKIRKTGKKTYFCANVTDPRPPNPSLKKKCSLTFPLYTSAVWWYFFSTKIQSSLCTRKRWKVINGAEEFSTSRSREPAQCRCAVGSKKGGCFVENGPVCWFFVGSICSLFVVFNWYFH